MSEESLEATQKAASLLVEKTMYEPGIHMELCLSFLGELEKNLAGTKADLNNHPPELIAQIGYNYLNSAFKERSKMDRLPLIFHLDNSKQVYLNALKAAALKSNTGIIQSAPQPE